MGKTGRNDDCPCGSGRKYKRCCGARRQSKGRLMWLAVGVGIAAAMLIAVASFTADRDEGPRRVWSPEHGHYHEVP